MHLRVLYVVMDCSGTSVRSTRKRRGANPPAVAAAANHVEGDAAASQKPSVAAAAEFRNYGEVVLWHLYVVNQMCLLLRTAGGQGVAIETVLPEIGLFVSSTGNLNIVTLVHMEKLSTMRSLETPVI